MAGILFLVLGQYTALADQRPRVCSVRLVLGPSRLYVTLVERLECAMWDWCSDPVVSTPRWLNTLGTLCGWWYLQVSTAQWLDIISTLCGIGGGDG